MSSISAPHWFKQAPATASIVVVTAACFLVSAAQSLSLSSNLRYSSFAQAFILYPPEMLSGAVSAFPLVGYMFMHLGLVHLVFNMALLYLVGREIERFTSAGTLLAAYLIAGIGSAALIVWCDPLASTVGASGAIYALMVIFVALCRRTRQDVRGPVVLILVNVAYTFIAVNVSVWGHLGGILMGLVLAWPVIYSPRRTRPLILVIIGVVVIFAAWGGLWRIPTGTL